jgi:hypothetical protein
MLRQRSNMVLTMSVAVFVAAVLGVQLGQSAIGAIHPVYFAGAAPPPRAVDGRERQPAQPAYYQAYDWEQGATARAVACSDNCGAPGPYEPSVFAEPPLRLAGSERRDQTPAGELEPWPPGQVSRDRSDAVMRYADYPVEAKPEAVAEDYAPAVLAEPYDE